MLQFLTRIFATPKNPLAQECYIALLSASRNPFFYTQLAVPDTIDGRFEMLALHGFLLQHRLRDDAPEFARALSECFFADLETAIREQGVGDSGVKRRIKNMAKAYHGRLQVYAAVLAKGDEALRSALARNLYGTVPEGNVTALARMAEYVQKMNMLLAATPTDIFTGNQFVWPQPEKI